MQRATTEVLYFEIGADNAPTMRVQPGRRVRGADADERGAVAR